MFAYLFFSISLNMTQTRSLSELSGLSVFTRYTLFIRNEVSVDRLCHLKLK